MPEPDKITSKEKDVDKDKVIEHLRWEGDGLQENQGSSVPRSGRQEFEVPTSVPEDSKKTVSSTGSIPHIEEAAEEPTTLRSTSRKELLPTVSKQTMRESLHEKDMGETAREIEDGSQSIGNIQQVDQEHPGLESVLTPLSQQQKRVQQEVSTSEVREIVQVEEALVDVGETKQDDEPFSDGKEIGQVHTSLPDMRKIRQETLLADDQMIGQRKTVSDTRMIRHREKTLSDVKDLSKQEKPISDIRDIEQQDMSLPGVKEIELGKKTFSDIIEVKKETDVKEIEQVHKSMPDMRKLRKGSLLSDDGNVEQRKTVSHTGVIRYQDKTLSEVKDLSKQHKSLSDVGDIEQQQESLTDVKGIKLEKEISFSDAIEVERPALSLPDIRRIKQESLLSENANLEQRKTVSHTGVIRHREKSVSGVKDLSKQEKSLSKIRDIEQQEVSPADVKEIQLEKEVSFSDAIEVKKQALSLPDVRRIRRESLLSDDGKIEQRKTVSHTGVIRHRDTSLPEVEEHLKLEMSSSDLEGTSVCEISESETDTDQRETAVCEVSGSETDIYQKETAVCEVSGSETDIYQKETAVCEVSESETDTDQKETAVCEVSESETDIEQKESISEVDRILEEHTFQCKIVPPDSFVYTATASTMFEEEGPSAGTNPLNMTWCFGINSYLPVYNLQDEDQKVLLYIGAHIAVLHDFNLNRQRHLQGHGSSISCACVSKDRRWIATADQGPESLIIVWDSFSGIPVCTIFDSHLEGGVVAIAMSKNLKYLATVGGGTVQRVSVWNWISNEEKPVCTAELHPKYGRQNYILFNPTDFTQLISNSTTQVIFYQWSDANLEFSAPSLTNRTFNKTVGEFSQSVFYLDSSKALTATSAGKFVVWDCVGPMSTAPNPLLKAYDKRAVKLMPVQSEAITTLLVYYRYFVTGDIRGQVKFYDEKLELANWYGNLELGPICSISFSKQPPVPASADTNYPQDTTLKGKQFAISNFVVSTYNGTVLHVTTDGTKTKRLLQEPFEVVNAIACHPRQPLVAIGSYSAILKVWDYKEKNQFVSRIFERSERLHCLTYNPDGSLLAAGFTDGSVHILDSLTLENDSSEPFRYARGTISHMSFSHNSEYLATADEEFTVTVFKRIRDGEDHIWKYLGRLRSHYKPIQSIIFGIHLDSDEPRLLTLGMDRMLVEYDLQNSTKNRIQVHSSDRIEQSAVPKCLAWYPPVTKESFMLTANDQFKMKLYNSTTKMCRKTLLGPTYGSAVKKMEVLSRKKHQDSRKGYLAYITDDKVGLQILPLDGNPHKSSALACHPDGVTNLATSFDGSYVFTAGGKDCTVLMWETNIDALEAAASLGGADLVPFYGLLEGGRDGELFRELEDYFYYAQLRSQGIDTTETRHLSTEIPLKEVPFVMRALGFYPTEQEIEDMLNEVKFSEYVDTGKQVTEIGLGDLIKLYCNHRPAFGLSMTELQQAFKVLGDENKHGEWVIEREELLYLLQTRGEHLTEEELAEYLTTLLGFNPEGGRSEIGSYDSTGAANLLDEEIALEITPQMFAAEILGLPVYSSEPEASEDACENIDNENVGDNENISQKS